MDKQRVGEGYTRASPYEDGRSRVHVQEHSHLSMNTRENMIAFLKFVLLPEKSRELANHRAHHREECDDKRDSKKRHSDAQR